jgi:8-hydroxy-5-deazaflavin:NADPH oxidoreductase
MSAMRLKTKPTNRKRKMMKTIGILGTGRMAVRLAKLFADCGNHVILGSRTPERAARIIKELEFSRVEPGSYEQAADAPAVLPAMFLRDGMLDTLEPLRSRLDGKLFVDITNPFNERYDDFILPWNTSGAEEIQKRFPKVRIVGAFKNVWFEVFDQPKFDGHFSDVYVVGNDEAAKKEFGQLVRGSPFRYVNAGKLANARYVERMTLFIAELGQREGFFPRMNWRLLGEPWKMGQTDTVKDVIARERDQAVTPA